MVSSSGTFGFNERRGRSSDRRYREMNKWSQPGHCDCFGSTTGWSSSRNGSRGNGSVKTHIRIIPHSKRDLIHVHDDSAVVVRSEKHAQLSDTDTHHNLPLRLMDRILLQKGRAQVRGNRKPQAFHVSPISRKQKGRTRSGDYRSSISATCSSSPAPRGTVA